MAATPRSVVRTVLHAPGFREARRAAERAVTPQARIELHRLDASRDGIEQRLHEQAFELEQMRRTVAEIEASMPAVLNAISSMSGAARLFQREVDACRRELEEVRAELDAARAELAGVRSRGETVDPGA